MKTLKKIIIGLLPLLMMAAGSLFIRPGYALTAPPSVTIDKLKFIDAATISGKVNGSDVTFYDAKATDSTRNFQPQGMDGSTYCNYGTTGNQRWGVNIDKNADLSSSSISATVGLGYWYTSGNVKQCKQIPASSISPSGNLTVDNSNGAATAFYKWQDPNIVYVNGGQTFQPKPAASTTPYINEARSGSCEASGIILLSDTSSGTLFALSSFGGSSVPSNISPYLSNPGNCRLISKQSINIAGSAPASANPGGITTCDPSNPNCVCSSQGCTLTGTTPPPSTVSSTSVDTCTSNSSGIAGGLAWIFCPLINAVGSAADGLNGIIEGQLRFDIKGYLPNTGGVYQTWSIIKNIVSALLIIILLVMVISQAISWGPFDAYTVRKVLPRLVFAVIFMQLSWAMGKWLVTVSNDLGDGIKQIMLAPFPAAGGMKLGNLLGHLGGPWAGLTGLTLAAGLVAAPFLTFLFLPGALFIGFSVLLAVVTALATVLFRNILIILLIAFSPLALLLWILPNQGMQKYFKLWSDNFTKILLLYPLMIGLIYAGRIFGWIAGGLDSPGPLDFIMVLVGFFVPYALLPKAFKWGGSAMSAGARAIAENRALKATQAGGRKFLKEDFGKYWQGRLARDMYSPYDKTFRFGMMKMGGVKFPMIQGRFAGRLASKHWMPTAHGRAQTLREGAGWAEERREDARKYNRRLFELGLTDGYAVDEKGKRFLPGKDETYDDNGFITDKNGNRRKLAQYDDPVSGEKKWAFRGPGTGAAKQALVDNVALDNVGNDDRVAKDAVEQLILTSSNPEIENSVITFGKNQGKRVFEADTNNEELGAWEREVGGSDKLYPEEAKANYDLQVHLLRNSYGGGPKILGRTMAERVADLGDTKEARDIKARYGDGGKDSKRTIMSPAHRTLYNLAHDMSPENFATQSLGFWQRQKRNAEEAEEKYGDKTVKGEIGTALAQRMSDLAQLGDAGAQMMRPIVGGEKGAEVDAILALSNDPVAIKDYVAKVNADGSTYWAPVHKTMADFAREAHLAHEGPPEPITPPSEPPTAEEASSGSSYRARTAPAPTPPTPEEEAAHRIIEETAPAPAGTEPTPAAAERPTAAAAAAPAAAPVAAPGVAAPGAAPTTPVEGVGVGGPGMTPAVSEELLARGVARGFRQAMRDTPLNVRMPEGAAGGGERIVELHAEPSEGRGLAPGSIVIPPGTRSVEPGIRRVGPSEETGEEGEEHPPEEPSS